jgi:23S rRNA (uracil1939-C5)-methyltransferase
LKKFMSDYSLSGYDEDTGKGDIRHLVVRQVSERIYVTLVTNRKINCAPLYKELSALFPNCALYQNVNRRRDNVILGDEWQLVGGEENASVDNMSFALHPAGFYQVNDYIRKQMYSFVASLCEGSVAIEAYSGAGLLSARLAQKANRVYGIEINEQAHASAEELKRANALEKLTPVLGDVGEKIGGVIAKCKGTPFVILDPPRSGVSEKAIEDLCSSGAESIVYISCNPATLARDLSKFCAFGYTVSSVTPYDMFPQTANVETLVCLSKKR